MALALRFISGKYQGGEFPLEDGRTIVIGRSSELDMVLVEDMVSRRHAQIDVKSGAIQIQDLGSTNGTFVNGEKITRSTLREGDRILVGTSILKVVQVRQRPEARQNFEAVAAKAERRSDEAPRMSGNLEEIPLPDLLQLFGTSRKDGVLVVRTKARTGRIYLKAGVLHHVEIDGLPDMPALKAAYRLLNFTQGVFELDPPDPRRFDPALDASAQEILMEGFRQMDEFNALKAKLPPLGARLSLKTPLDAPLHQLEPDHLDVLQLALNSPSFGALLDRTKRTDYDTAVIIKALINRGYLAFKT
jgi:hypothetical protein